MKVNPDILNHQEVQEILKENINYRNKIMEPFNDRNSLIHILKKCGNLLRLVPDFQSD
jgi:hypothetical protein